MRRERIILFYRKLLKGRCNLNPHRPELYDNYELGGFWNFKNGIDEDGKFWFDDKGIQFPMGI